MILDAGAPTVAPRRVPVKNANLPLQKKVLGVNGCRLPREAGGFFEANY